MRSCCHSRAAALAQRIEGYVHQLHALPEARRRHAAELDKLLGLRVFELASDPQRPLLPPRAEAAVPNVDLAPLDAAVMRLSRAARAFDAAYAAQLSGPARISNERARRINGLLRSLEQLMTDPRGLPGRSWYTNLIFAPASTNGYAGEDAARCARGHRTGTMADCRGVRAPHGDGVGGLQRSAGACDRYAAPGRLTSVARSPASMRAVAASMSGWMRRSWS